jgi:dipeptidyl aminopeptidase/acylaminoacyl peptidase
MYRHLSLLFIFSASATGQTPPAPQRDPAPLGVPFDRYTTTDRLGRTVTFYLSRPPKGATKSLPLAVMVQGSGASSVFRQRDGKTFGGLQMLVLAAAKGLARVLAAEKPGVQFGDDPKNPGSAEDARPEFRREHTLPRWVEAVATASRAAYALPDIDRGRTLVMGHSEGGIVAAHVAATEPGVTHVALLAGGGPTQLFDLAELARQGHFYQWVGADPEARARRLYDDWAKVRADPDSADKLWLGHPHRRWTTFLATSPLKGLVRSKARVYLAQGTADIAVAVSGFEVLRAELLAKGRDVTAERLDGLDHSFRRPGQDARDPGGLRDVFGLVLDWWLARPPG